MTTTLDRALSQDECSGRFVTERTTACRLKRAGSEPVGLANPHRDTKPAGLSSLVMAPRVTTATLLGDQLPAPGEIGRRKPRSVRGCGWRRPASRGGVRHAPATEMSESESHRSGVRRGVSMRFVAVPAIPTELCKYREGSGPSTEPKSRWCADIGRGWRRRSGIGELLWAHDDLLTTQVPWVKLIPFGGG